MATISPLLQDSLLIRVASSSSKRPSSRPRQYTIRGSLLRIHFIVRILLVLLPTHPLKHVEASRAYPLGCSNQDSSFYDYDNYPFPPPNIPIKSTEDYQIVERLGTGKFSDVFSAVPVDRENQNLHPASQQQSPNAQLEVDPRSLVVIKCLKPVTDRKIRRELLVLSHASKLPNLARLLAVVLHPEFYAAQRSSAMLPRMPSFVLQHAGVNSQWLCHPIKSGTQQSGSGTSAHNSAFLSEYEIKYFLYHLLVALDALHSIGIMHRDVKPRNVLISRHMGSRINPSLPGGGQRPIHNFDNYKASPSPPPPGPLMLIDLGLADFYLPNTKYNVRVASRHYKSPELLIGYQYYHYSIDIWPVGCILAGLLFHREPFFRGKDNIDQLGKIVSVLGTPDLIAYISRIKADISPDVRKVLNKYALLERNRPGNRNRADMRVPWLSFRAGGGPIPSQESLDLLDKLLLYDHDVRLTAREAMAHPFFDAVRDRVNNEVKASCTVESEYY